MIWILGFLGIACRGSDEAPEVWPARACTAPAPAAGSVEETSREDDTLVMDDGVSLAVAARRPKGVDCAGLVVEAPPGFEEGRSALDGEQAKTLAKAGLVVVAFDPRGRGDSEGEEDINGERGQDDFAAVARWAAGLDGVDASSVVIYSRSIGGALASGALSRHADLTPLAWVDFESPGWLEDDMDHTTEHTHDRMWALADETDDPDAWFLERSPASYIGDVVVPYHRLQGYPDHALNYMNAAAAMLGGATASPEVTLNGEPVTGPLSPDMIQEAAIAGGVEPLGEWAGEQVLEAF